MGGGSWRARRMARGLRRWGGPGRARVSCCHVAPPSVDLNRPLVAPLYALLYPHGPCRADQSTAYTVRAFDGSKARSIAPVFSSLYSTRSNVAPPSVERYTPRSSFGPYGWPSAATNSLAGSAGSTMI